VILGTANVGTVNSMHGQIIQRLSNIVVADQAVHYLSLFHCGFFEENGKKKNNQGEKVEKDQNKLQKSLLEHTHH
jgi:hypothetical protein